MTDWRVALLKRLGAKPTRANLKFLERWQVREGGHTHNDAQFNWLNTTRDAPGAIGSINSVGVKKYRDFQSGVNATAQTLRNGRYRDIVQALKSGDPYARPPRAGLSTWVSGSPTARMDYAAKVLGQPVEQTRPSRAPAPGAPGKKVKLPKDPFGGDWDALLQTLFSDDPEWLGIMQALPDPFAVAKDTGPHAPARMPSAASKDVKGKPVTNGRLFPGTKWTGTHVTDGLDWNGGAKTARDIMAAAGTLVLAPESGRIVRHGSAQGGQALYFMADSGHLYWMGHIDDMAPVGARVKKGQGIARISADHAAPHLHIDRYYGKNPGRYT